MLLIDELPEVLHTLHKSGNNLSAISILKNLRRWRQDKAYKKLQFVITGSIGIHHVVKNIEGRVSDLNDFKIIGCPALNKGEFIDYLFWATKDASISFENNEIEYLRGKIQYFAPYFINLMLNQIDITACTKNKNKVDKEAIDNAFEKIVTQHDYFSDWRFRLIEYFKPEDFKFANRILTHIAHKNTISIQEIYDTAVKFDKTDDYMDLVFELEKDGYIIETNKQYLFISPFLKEYWKRINPIFNS